MQAPSEPTRKQGTARQILTLDEQLERKLAALRRHRGTLRFFETHRSLLSSGNGRADVAAKQALAKRRVRQLTRSVAVLRAKLRLREARRRSSLPAKAAICEVFRTTCADATAVAWCESRLSTTARNGQYLGLFQMGSHARRLFGHGPTAIDQAEAAHRYFLRSGRDWSPWSCRWAVS
jgi:hypothetical protein